MGLRVFFGEDVDEGYLDNLDWVDGACYEPQYWGEAERTIARYRKNERSFVFIEDDETGRLAGYLNFFPCERGLYEDNLFACPTIRDDDITPDEVAPYRTDENHLFIISLAIHPNYQGGEAIKTLTRGFVDYLNGLQSQGFPITDICGTAVSPHGKKALRNLLFRELRTLDDGNVVFLCDGSRLQKLLTGEQYFKTYRDDLYILMPLAEHEANLRVARRLYEQRDVRVQTNDAPAQTSEAPDTLHEAAADSSGSTLDSPPALSEVPIGRLKDFIAYECSNEVVKELEFLDMGSFDFLHTTDEYPCATTESTPASEEIIVGDVKGHAVLVAHRATHMFVLTIALPAYPYSTTQMEDQVSYGYLKIRNPKEASEYVPFAEYLRKEYGLHACGQAKCVDYLSNKPKDSQEFQDILAAEAYNNFETNYEIASDELADMCENNQAQFEDYEVYLSSRAIAYVKSSFADDPLERVEDFADYLFVVIMTLFQNAALAKVNIKVTNLLEADGDVSPRMKLAIDREYGKTVRFWEVQNFKYLSTQMESARIKEAFLNDELREAYNEHQEYLEHVVEVKAAIADNRNGMIINVVATILAIISIQPFVVELLQGIYGVLGIQAEYAALSFNFTVFGGAAFFLIILLMLRRRDAFVQRRRM